MDMQNNNYIKILLMLIAEAVCEAKNSAEAVYESAIFPQPRPLTRQESRLVGCLPRWDARSFNDGERGQRHGRLAVKTDGLGGCRS